jgi:peptidoglycan/LPS O-acetylase OafA/YrhL
MGSRQWQILGLILMALIGVGLGIWLLRAGDTTLGCVCVGVFLWRGQQFSVWFIAPTSAPSDTSPPLTSRWQRLLWSIVCVLGAAVCAVGVYLWRWWPEEWQAGLVFVLLGLLVLAPVTIKEIQCRRKALGTPTTQ